MTDAATRFVGATTFQALSGEPVRSSLWDEAAEAAMGHIELARWPTAVVIAPATANTLAKLAHGLADDLVSTLCLATDAPIAVAVIVGHNHPSGNPEPSAADRAVTARLKQALALVDLRLLDHFVIADGPPVSLAARGWV